jgi:hypothetical protein
VFSSDWSLKEHHLNNFLVIIRKLFRAFILLMGIGIAIPLVIGMIFEIPPGKILALTISTIILQTWASPAGVGLKIPPGIILVTMTCVALSVVLAIFEILDTLALTSVRIKAWLEKTEKKVENYKVLYKYGVFACFFIALLPGLGIVITTVIAWTLLFNKWLSVFFIVLAFFIASLVAMSLTLGILPAALP